MDPVIIVVVVVVVVLIVVALAVLVPRARRQANERRQVQATAHRREAPLRPRLLRLPRKRGRRPLDVTVPRRSFEPGRPSGTLKRA